jgi:hypothetical protein
MHACDARARSGPRVAARHGKMITPPTLQQIYTDYYSCSSYGLRVRIGPYPRHNPMASAPGAGLAGMPVRTQV